MRHLVFLFFLALQTQALMADDWLHRQKVSGSFDEVKEALVMAIENRGLVINYTSHIADMLERTGVDLGASRKIFDKAEIIEFCSAALSRQMMEIDPHNIVMCPFAIAVYTLPNEKNTVWLSYRQPFGKAAGLVGGLLDGVLSEAAQ